MKKSFIKRLVALALVIVSVFSISAVAFAESATGTYNHSAVYIYYRPGSSNFGLVNLGATCTIHGYRDVGTQRWYRVTITSNTTNGDNLRGRTGWSKEDYITVNSGTVTEFEFTSATQAFGSSTLKNGSSGNYVRNLQLCLSNEPYNFYSGNIDGDFGTGTESAVRLFQQARGITVDGKVGSGTRAELWAVYQDLLNSEGY